MCSSEEVVFIFRASCRLPGMVKSERTQEKLTQQPPRGFHLSWILLQLCSLTSLIEKSTVPKYSSFWVYWPLFSVFLIPGLLSPEAYFCLIYLTPLLNLYHHACLFSSPDFTLICQWLWKKWQQNFSWTWLLASMENRTKLILLQSPVFSSGVPISLGSQQISYICGVWHCKEFNLETRFPFCVPVPYLSNKHTHRWKNKKVQGVSVLLLAVPCGIRHLLLSIASTASEVWTDKQDPWADNQAVWAPEMVSRTPFALGLGRKQWDTGIPFSFIHLLSLSFTQLLCAVHQERWDMRAGIYWACG